MKSEFNALVVLPYRVREGNAHPLGATVTNDGVNFSMYSEHATAVTLLLFQQDGDLEPIQEICLDPLTNRTSCFWHVFIDYLKPGVQYAYRVDGPNLPEAGLRYNPKKVLIDPYAKGNSDTLWERVNACHAEDNLHTSMRSVVIDYRDYDWEDDRPLQRPIQDTIIYEMHVRGFTASPTAQVKHPGTFRSVIEKIPYLQQLGVTAVELLPVFEFDDKEIVRVVDDHELYNYWGYSTIGYFAPDSRYCVDPQLGSHLNEFRDMVKALHRAGIEVILDVVYNHTNEGNHEGPVISFKGFDNLTYYYLSSQNKYYYMDYTGCGNTFNVNHPVVEKLILDSLEFWVNEMHVDGFRFDEGSVLTRDENGIPTQHPPVLWNIELSNSLANTKLFTEAWDAAGLYQIGSFPGYSWAEWNGRYRDDIRRFVRGDVGMINDVATRISGSSDLYNHDLHGPTNSLNFITCHDGFTMMDLVSYNEKHNWANGESNQDGINENYSSNYGYEGKTSDEGIQAFRFQQIRNFLSILMLSQGVPMLLAGDEMGNSQYGNNNAYCQNNEISWLDWTLTETNESLIQFCKKLIDLRKSVKSLRRKTFFTGAVNERGFKDLDWHGCKLYSPGWNNPSSRVLACTIGSFVRGEPDLYVALNMEQQPLAFEVPPAPVGTAWRVYSDSSFLHQDGESIHAQEIKVQYHSVLILTLEEI
ncbi:glycogen debranching protein GlgX [Paenibacillus sp. SC116]|uniref:glycogen debranching protein GlgX n=1 Tax=Paenibacillus sp. SC116 TaxID=2968986 RepID=UPI00215A95FE|nr:glycogen debranching protein GlgX [Paenibacillus sp. SC116]MCR8842261.1 glycogen debranching protein GlgX [Paenibacillus sp. SC116]